MDNEEFMAQIKQIRKLPKDKQVGAALKLAVRYRITPIPWLNSPLKQLIMKEDIDYSKAKEFDTCLLNDDWEYFINHLGSDYYFPIENDALKRAQFSSHPVSISISTRASRNEVIDFIKNNWTEIRQTLNQYEYDPPQYREKPMHERDKFIWDNKDIEPKKLVDLVKKEFRNKLSSDDRILSSNDVEKIISREKESRLRKLSLDNRKRSRDSA